MDASRLWTALKIALALLLIGFVASRTDLESLLELRARISVPWLAVVSLLYICLSLMKAGQYYLLLGRKVDFPMVLNVVIVQNALSNFIAVGAGVASYLAMLRVERGVHLGRAALVFLLTKVGDFITLGVILLLSSLYLWNQVRAVQTLIVPLLAVMGLGVSMFFLAVLFHGAFLRVLERALEVLRLRRFAAVEQGLGMLALLAGQKRSSIVGTALLAAAYSVVYQSVTLVWAYATLRVFRFPIDLLNVAWVNSIMQLASNLPIHAFGGLGVTEGASMVLYTIVGISQTRIVPVLVGSRLLFYLLNLLLLLYLPLYSLISNRSPKPAR